MISDTPLEAARIAIAHGSKSFAAAARLFDPYTRDSAMMLYAWCRHCDDVIDGQVLGYKNPAAPPLKGIEALLHLEQQTKRAFMPNSTVPLAHPAFEALREVVRRHALPEHYALDHLTGFRMDVQERLYHTFDDTLDYCYHVAGVVGLMMAWIMGVRDEAVLARARDLGNAFQLTNIARDLVEDARNNRLYLPADWLKAAGLPARTTAIIDPRHRAALAGVAARLIAEAEPLYASALIGIKALPFRSRWAIATARGVYRQIGIEVKRHGALAWDSRVSTSRQDKIRHVGQGFLRALWRF
jgi:15-cis-phytoene synthase